MKPSTVLFLILSGATQGFSAEPATAAPTTTAPEVPESSSSPAATGSTSPETTAKISSGLSKATPSETGDTANALTDFVADKDVPRNAIIRLPQFDVRNDRPPLFRQRHLLTPLGRVDLVLRRHPGLKFGPLAFLNVRRGLEMLEEEDAIERRREMAELFRFAAAVDQIAPPEPGTGERTNAVEVSE